MPPGSRKQVQSAHTGMKSRLWKIVYVDGAEQSREILHTDTYNPSKAIIKVGPAAPAVAEPLPAHPSEIPDIITQPSEETTQEPVSTAVPEWEDAVDSPQVGPGE